MIALPNIAVNTPNISIPVLVNGPGTDVPTPQPSIAAIVHNQSGFSIQVQYASAETSIPPGSSALIQFAATTQLIVIAVQQEVIGAANGYVDVDLYCAADTIPSLAPGAINTFTLANPYTIQLSSVNVAGASSADFPGLGGTPLNFFLHGYLITSVNAATVANMVLIVLAGFGTLSFEVPGTGTAGNPEGVMVATQTFPNPCFVGLSAPALLDSSNANSNTDASLFISF